MTTRFHRDSSENLIVEIIKVIPETSKEKKPGVGWGGGQQGQRCSCLARVEIKLSLEKWEDTHYFWGIYFPENSLFFTLTVTIFAKKM